MTAMGPSQQQPWKKNMAVVATPVTQSTTRSQATAKVCCSLLPTLYDKNWSLYL